MQKITPIDIQHKTFKKALQGYDRAEVDQFLDEIIETLRAIDNRPPGPVAVSNGTSSNGASARGEEVHHG